VGSITKTAVAVITLELAGEGRLRLDDSIERWVPGLVPNGPAITIRMLLNHTSGIYNYTDDPDFIPTIVADPYRIWAPQELVAVAIAHRPVFAPGQGWSYSNTGYILLGLALETATGQPLQDLVAERIVRPLHLRATFFASSAEFRGRYAHGYAPPSLTGDGYVDLSMWSPTSAWAAGALVSSAPDLRRFYQALLAGRLLPPALLGQMTTTVETGNPGSRYGLGIYSMDTPCGTVWGHDGGIAGYVSFALNDREGSRSAVVLLPTQPDDAIAARHQEAVATAVCEMFDSDSPASVRS
jgi:D-alanyl-D-alanine carboxypeptidase